MFGCCFHGNANHILKQVIRNFILEWESFMRRWCAVIFIYFCPHSYCHLFSFLFSNWLFSNKLNKLNFQLKYSKFSYFSNVLVSSMIMSYVNIMLTTCWLNFWNSKKKIETKNLRLLTKYYPIKNLHKNLSDNCFNTKIQSRVFFRCRKRDLLKLKLSKLRWNQCWEIIDHCC
jgi:hypothetical protein